MPRPTNLRAIATKASIQALFAMVEIDGEVEIRVASQHQALSIRNRCYAFRSKVRKDNAKVTGIESSVYDGVEFAYGPVQGCDEGRWWFKMTYDIPIEFELIVPECHVGEVYGFDLLPDTDVPQLLNPELSFLASAEEHFNSPRGDPDDIPF